MSHACLDEFIIAVIFADHSTVVPHDGTSRGTYDLTPVCLRLMTETSHPHTVTKAASRGDRA
jgi:hypothetical protein